MARRRAPRRRRNGRKKNINIGVLSTAAGVNLLARFGVFESMARVMNPNLGWQNRFAPMISAVKDGQNWIYGVGPVVAVGFARQAIGQKKLFGVGRFNVNVF